MRVQQNATREGNDIVLTLTEQPSGRVLGKRVYENAAQYFQHIQRRGDQEVMVIEIPVLAKLNIRPGG